MIKVKPLLPAITLAMLAMSCCNSSNADRAMKKTMYNDTGAPIQQDQSVPNARAQKENISQADATATIESITISPLDPTRDATVSVSVKTNPAELPDMEMYYILWVNGAISQNVKENTFSLAAFKKNDFFYVDAVLLNTDREVYRKRSKMVKILNTSPVIRSIDLPELKGPGTYDIKINATDADSDPLRYSLEGEMLPEGIAIDEAGLAKISFTDKSPENIVFWVVVKDNEDGEARQEIKFTFKKELVRNKKNPEVNK